MKHLLFMWSGLCKVVTLISKDAHPTEETVGVEFNGWSEQICGTMVKHRVLYCYFHQIMSQTFHSDLRKLCKLLKEKRKKECNKFPLKPLTNLSCYLNYTTAVLHSIRSSVTRRPVHVLALAVLLNTCIYWHLMALINSLAYRKISLNSIFGSTVEMLSQANVKCRTQYAGEQAGRGTVPQNTEESFLNLIMKG